MAVVGIDANNGLGADADAGVGANADAHDDADTDNTQEPAASASKTKKPNKAKTSRKKSKFEENEQITILKFDACPEDMNSHAVDELQKAIAEISRSQPATFSSCYAHFCRNRDRKLHLIKSSQHQAEVKAMTTDLHYCRSQSMFDSLANLVLAWLESNGYSEFKRWLDQFYLQVPWNTWWYPSSGVRGVLATNNPLESSWVGMLPLHDMPACMSTAQAAVFVAVLKAVIIKYLRGNRDTLLHETIPRLLRGV